MSELKEDLSFKELTEPQAPASDPDYLAWKERKIRAALKQAEDRSCMVPAKTVWEKFGLER
ncbi:hypothetical protein EDF70_102758 [Neorhizobium sp. JUb45]|nr:hypothetical protein EDF70_102758 [Neorhizobium sp. JUb45]